GRRELIQHRVDGLGDALAQVAVATVAQLDGLVSTRRRARGHGRATERAVVQQHLHLDGGVASRIEDLPGSDLLDKRHVCSLGKFWCLPRGGGTVVTVAVPLAIVPRARCGRAEAAPGCADAGARVCVNDAPGRTGASAGRCRRSARCYVDFCSNRVRLRAAGERWVRAFASGGRWAVGAQCMLDLVIVSRLMMTP